MKRLLVIVGILAAVVGGWIFMVELMMALNPSPLDTQPNPYGTSEAPTPSTVVIHLSYDELVEQVIPAAGSTVSVQWNDMGQQLVTAGAIDLEKFENQYDGLTTEQQEILQGNRLTEITFTPENIQFWTNVLWSLGLVQQSKVLSEGPMMQNVGEIPLENYASTGGWTLGSLDAVTLYNSVSLMSLTPEQDDLVYRVTENIFRPCCGNPTVFPDCNHGMAVLGLLELLASQGANEDEMYQAALVFNSYAFPHTYITLAAYFASQDTTWTEVDPAVALGPEYSSGSGARHIAAVVGPIPGSPNQGGSCST
ncbi:MAG: hypothetical protein HY866_11480 [Chloroflexi bacterium]|nr:hypothetical protein [Chloroflexota bacterium]